MRFPRKTDKSYFDLTDKELTNVSQLKLFNILKDYDGTYFQNIFRTFNINEDVVSNSVYYDIYEVDNDCWWDNISYEVYGTPHLWYLLCMMNNVVNPYEELDEGDIIKYMRREYLYAFLKDIEGISGM